MRTRLFWQATTQATSAPTVVLPSPTSSARRTPRLLARRARISFAVLNCLLRGSTCRPPLSRSMYRAGLSRKRHLRASIWKSFITLLPQRLKAPTKLLSSQPRSWPLAAYVERPQLLTVRTHALGEDGVRLRVSERRAPLIDHMERGPRVQPRLHRVVGRGSPQVRSTPTTEAGNSVGVNDRATIALKEERLPQGRCEGGIDLG